MVNVSSLALKIIFLMDILLIEEQWRANYLGILKCLEINLSGSEIHLEVLCTHIVKITVFLPENFLSWGKSETLNIVSTQLH